jgi:hypothetical protein
MHYLSPTPIKITRRFSIWLAGYILLAHLFALILVFMLDLDLFLTLGLIALILVSLIYHWRKELLQLRANSVIGLEWSNNMGWQVRLRSGSNLKADLLPTSLVSRWLVILNFKTNNSGRHSIAIPADAIDSNLLRQLKVLLKMHNHFGV